MAKTKDKIIFERPPVVAVLGHVDHGKTTLLDVIRKSDVAKKEQGGITQHIGAYQVIVDTKEGKQAITFIDTPGHEAFSKIRSRGASVTDLVLLVISAVEGVKPQTEESIAHIKKAGVPFIVVATKTDLKEANIDRVHKHLGKVGIKTEGYGGDIVVIPVSSVKKEGISELLEMILLISQMNNIKGKKEDPLLGVIIESEMDHKKGAIGTILIKKGMLKRGDEVFAGEDKVKIRAMFDEYGKPVNQAGPSKPVEVLGFKKNPSVGLIVTKEKVASPEVFQFKKSPAKEEDQKKLKVILKADTVSSLEAILEKLVSLEVVVIDAGLGEIGEADILLGHATKAFVIGFNTKITKSAQKIAEQDKVYYKTYSIIYELLDEVLEVSQMIAEGDKEEILGTAKIMVVFSTSQGQVAGLSVLSGRLSKGDKVKLSRGDEVLGAGRVLGLKQGKDDVNKVEQGKECGAKLSSNLDFRLGDMLESILVKEIKLG